MPIELWPVVGRSDVVRAFRPGESGTAEGPFRTLRKKHLATEGRRVPLRSGAYAAGQLTVFSVLNVDAARLARRGRLQLAKACTKAADALENSGEFEDLITVLRGHSRHDIDLFVEGAPPQALWTAAKAPLKALAQRTFEERKKQGVKTVAADMIAGTVSEVASADVLKLTTTSGVHLIPRWLAETAHRDKPGDQLAIVTERIEGAGEMTMAFAAIEVGGGEVPERRFSPFGRSMRLNRLTEAETRWLSRTPAPLKIVVPVKITG